MDTIDLATLDLPSWHRAKGWIPAPQFRVDVKTYGMTKHQPAVVLATCEDELLLKLLVEPQSAWWSVKPGGFVSCSMDQTKQGYRFTRTITKLMRVIDRLSREAARKRATAAQLATRAAARVGRDGECQICAHRQIVQKDVLVLHGYERPGVGSVLGECHGRGFSPYEVSCERLRWYVETFLAEALASTRKELGNVPRVKQLSQQIYAGQEFGRSRYRTEWVKRGEPDFKLLEARYRTELEQRIRALEFEIQQQGRRLSAWKPAKKTTTSKKGR